jgi:hypothetical protein
MNSAAARLFAVVVGFCVLAVVIVAVAVLGGGGDDGGDAGSAEEIAQKVAEAIRQPGKVYFADGSDGSLAWIDAENQKYRGRTSVLDGSRISVGDGWSEVTYDPGTNAVSQDDTTPTGAQRPRIDDPMVRWMDPLAALAFSDVLTVAGRETAEGVEVIVLEGSTPLRDSNGNAVGTLFGRVEVDAVTYLPHAFQPRTVSTGSITPSPTPQGLDPRVTYASQFLELSELPADFFDRSVVEAEIKSNQSEFDKVREMGLSPVWFGLYYDGTPYGELQLPPTVSVEIDAQDEAAAVRYALVSPTTVATDAVIIRVRKDAAGFTRPQIPQFAGELPEDEETVTLSDGTQATLYTSILTIEALPCPATGCIVSDARLYRRLILQRGETAVQIEVSPRILEDGTDSNGFNSRDGIMALAEALVDVPADIGQG